MRRRSAIGSASRTSCAADPHRAVGRFGQPVDQPEQGGLAGTGRSDNAREIRCGALSAIHRPGTPPAAVIDIDMRGRNGSVAAHGHVPPCQGDRRAIFCRLARRHPARIEERAAARQRVELPHGFYRQKSATFGARALAWRRNWRGRKRSMGSGETDVAALSATGVAACRRSQGRDWCLSRSRTEAPIPRSKGASLP